MWPGELSEGMGESDACLSGLLERSIDDCLGGNSNEGRDSKDGLELSDGRPSEKGFELEALLRGLEKLNDGR